MAIADNKTPVFAQVGESDIAITIAAALAIGTDTPTGLELLTTAGPKGSIITRLTAIPRGTCSASCLMLFTSKDAGATKKLKDSELLPTVSVATNTAIPEILFGNYSETNPLRLGPNERLYVGNQVALAAGLVWTAERSNY